MVLSRPTLRTRLGRALKRRCPHCGASGIFLGWWTMRDHCHRCGHRFEREPGYWVGAVIFNTALAIRTIFLPLVVGLALTWPEAPWTILTVVSIVCSVVVPTIFYPYARTL